MAEDEGSPGFDDDDFDIRDYEDDRDSLPLHWLIHLPVIPLVYFLFDGSVVSRLARVAGYVALVIVRPVYMAWFDRLVHRNKSPDVVFRGAAKLMTGEPNEEWLWREAGPKVLSQVRHGGELRVTGVDVRWLPNASARHKGAHALVIPLSAVEHCGIMNDLFAGHGQAFVEFAGEDWWLGFEVASAAPMQGTLEAMFAPETDAIDLTSGTAKPRWYDPVRHVPPQVPLSWRVGLIGAWAVAFAVLMGPVSSASASDYSTVVDVLTGASFVGAIAAVIALALVPNLGVRLSLAAASLGVIVSLVADLPERVGLATAEIAVFGALLSLSLFVFGQRRLPVESGA